jgi:hypothetical protein
MIQTLVAVLATPTWRVGVPGRCEAFRGRGSVHGEAHDANLDRTRTTTERGPTT